MNTFIHQYRRMTDNMYNRQKRQRLTHCSELDDTTYKALLVVQNTVYNMQSLISVKTVTR